MTSYKRPPAPESLKDLLVDILDTHKAEDIEVIDLNENAYLADYMIVATGRSSRQVVGLAEKIIERLAFYDIKDIRKEGMSTGDWVVLDTGDVMIHLFKPEVRSFYNIEKMWGDFAEMASSSSSPRLA
ncbi:MAG: ribosome silencing factor [Pseudobdellovibrionaceae bacterium]